MIKNWKSAFDKIMDYLDIPGDKRPLFNISTNNRTSVRQDSSTGKILSIEFKLTDCEDYNLASLFHECWHIKQICDGKVTKYSDEDKKKYANTGHNMYMLYKYDFEAEAQGRAWAFMYYYYYLRSRWFGTNEQGLLEKYSNMDQGYISDFDSEDDCIAINTKLKKSYEDAINSFMDEFKTKPECLDDDAWSYIPDEKRILVSKFGLTIVSIDPPRKK